MLNNDSQTDHQFYQDKHIYKLLIVQSIRILFWYQGCFNGRVFLLTITKSILICFHAIVTLTLFHSATVAQSSYSDKFQGYAQLGMVSSTDCKRVTLVSMLTDAAH